MGCPSHADSCTYRLEREDLVVSELFQLFDSVKHEIGILDWGIKMTTLEDGKPIYSQTVCDLLWINHPYTTTGETELLL